MLTNWSTTERRLCKFKKLRLELKMVRRNLLKRDATRLKRKLSHLQTYLGGIKYMTAIPDIVIIIDQHKEYTALRECIILGIPTICLIDTNCDLDLVDFPIPANDDTRASMTESLESVEGGFYRKSWDSASGRAGVHDEWA
ncbi:hypothetical protein RHMOL_Rhmol05G0146200 [Rhododendron molle]|uniref:Uncharacterized protein n=1 Tax=Rhododendron molle TaxID=49168 RepID=A0ACC0NR49_RHOML|nr:hypothetical protein RHMOL_Rhmol05G0146200 [Rhododendron molle]